jgi:hypothetical protein
VPVSLILPVALQGLGPGSRLGFVSLGLGLLDVWRRGLVHGLEGRRLRPRRGRQGRKVSFIDEAFAKPPGHFGPVALAADGEIGPFAIAISVAVAFPAPVAILGAGRRWKARGRQIA